jgi:hypothetical protein
MNHWPNYPGPLACRAQSPNGWREAQGNNTASIRRQRGLAVVRLNEIAVDSNVDVPQNRGGSAICQREQQWIAGCAYSLSGKDPAPLHARPP